MPRWVGGQHSVCVCVRSCVCVYVVEGGVAMMSMCDCVHDGICIAWLSCRACDLLHTALLSTAPVTPLPPPCM